MQELYSVVQVSDEPALAGYEVHTMKSVLMSAGSRENEGDVREEDLLGGAHAGGEALERTQGVRGGGDEAAGGVPGRRGGPSGTRRRPRATRGGGRAAHRRRRGGHESGWRPHSVRCVAASLSLR